MPTPDLLVHLAASFRPAPRGYRRGVAEVIAEVVRSGFVEGHHYGSWVVLDPTGEVVASAGDVTSQILPRSCNKPLQAVGMVSAGLALDGSLLALACASHSGESFHLEGVRRILADAGLTEEALQTPMDWPLEESERDALLRAGGHKAPVFMNCSGKHAAMLATCVANGWDVATYPAPDHPLQQAIVLEFADLTGEPVEHVAVDGCGAPLLSTSLTGLARAFSRVATARGHANVAQESGERHTSPTSDIRMSGYAPSAAKVAEAIRAHPAYVSGTQRDERKLLTAIPGAIGKAGAESCYAVALPNGRAFATKTDDGAARARPVLMAALLQEYGDLESLGADVEAVRRTGEWPILGAGVPVGEVRAVLSPAARSR